MIIDTPAVDTSIPHVIVIVHHVLYFQAQNMENVDSPLLEDVNSVVLYCREREKTKTDVNQFHKNRKCTTEEMKKKWAETGINVCEESVSAEENEVYYKKKQIGA